MVFCADCAEERQHLQTVLTTLNAVLEHLDARVRAYAEDVQAQKTYLWEHRADMDHAEKISTRQSVEQAVMTGAAAAAMRGRLQKLAQSPYFGRVDFVEAGQPASQPVYIGQHSFFDDASKSHVVYDWRAPIASLFYDYETGPARYQAPAGEIHGEITRKRQYRIRDGRLEMLIESAVQIVDEVLQEELSRTSDNRMKTIVATIQRDQNAIIRDAESAVLIIQGVAGSGKTSIALHRVAYLLYRFKDSLSARLLDKDDPALQERTRFKASAELLKQLDRYVAHLETIRLQPVDIWLGKRLVPAWFITESWQKQRALPPTERLKRLAYLIEKNIGLHYNYDVSPEERAEIKAALKGMHQEMTLRQTLPGLLRLDRAPGAVRTGGRSARIRRCVSAGVSQASPGGTAESLQRRPPSAD